MVVRSLCALSALSALVTPADAQSPIPMVPMRPVAAQPVVAELQDVSNSRAIDLVLCLDTSKSMDGLINAARENLWSIVNDLATLQPQPELRVALLAYGSPRFGQQTGFVSIETGLTSDLDLVSQKLFALSTDGGNEFVARVVRRSLQDLDWSKDASALKMIFVAGNEPATQDGEYDVFEVAGQAIASSVLVNTIFCGNEQKAEVSDWRKVAMRADGKFASIDQDHQVAIATPFDQELSDLSAALNKTYLTYGKQRGAWAQNQVAQDQNATTLNLGTAAQRCVTKASTLYFNPSFDLVDACKQKDFALTSVAKEDLPEELRKLTAVQLQARVDEMAKKRASIQKQVAAVNKKRTAFLVVERKKLGDVGARRFEQAMLESVRAQARSRGFTRRADAEAPTEVPNAVPNAVPTPAPAAAPATQQPQTVTNKVSQVLRSIKQKLK